MLACPRLKVHARPPRLAQRVGGRAHHAGQPLDPIKLAQFRLRQNGGDGLPQPIVVHGLRQTPRKPRRQLLEGHDLQPVPPPPRRLEPQLAHPKQAVGDDCVARSCHPAHANSRKVASNPSNGSHERVLIP